MKFLHLADLHIGKIVNGFSMLEEQRHAFEQIIDYIDSEQPDAVLIAGDVYDRAVPSVEAARPHVALPRSTLFTTSDKIS